VVFYGMPLWCKILCDMLSYIINDISLSNVELVKLLCITNMGYKLYPTWPVVGVY
jgi:hypothetical protein